METSRPRSTSRALRAFIVGSFFACFVVQAGAQIVVGDQRDALGLIGTTPKAKPHPGSPGASLGTSIIERWNSMALDATGLDHTPVAPGELRVYGEQLGPTRASRAMAIVHIAMFEAYNAIDPAYASYVGLVPRAEDHSASVTAAVAQAAHDTLAALFPSQVETFDAALLADLNTVQQRQAGRRGIELGNRAAVMILGMRSNDGSQHAEPVIGVDFQTSNAPGKWRKDPISQVAIALGARWSEVRPFTLRSADQFRAPEPPALNSKSYASAFEQVRQLGGDGTVTPTLRTPEQTFVGTYWAYDGMPSLCAPPRLYNQIAMTIARQQGTEGLALARLLALLNTAMADAAISVWEAKYYYQYWRPITAFREADTDGNPATQRDPKFTPLGAPASNIEHGQNFTPPFPTYPSGHAGFGGAVFELLKRYYGTDEIAFTFMSDEWDGSTFDAEGMLRPARPRSFSSLSQAADENGQSRIYLGIHWIFDKTEGLAEGRKVGDYVYEHALRPLFKKP